MMAMRYHTTRTNVVNNVKKQLLPNHRLGAIISQQQFTNP